MMKRLICRLLGHRWKGDIPLSQTEIFFGVVDVCGRCGHRAVATLDMLADVPLPVISNEKSAPRISPGLSGAWRSTPPGA